MRRGNWVCANALALTLSAFGLRSAGASAGQLFAVWTESVVLPSLVIPAQSGTQASIAMKARDVFARCCTFFRTHLVLREERWVPACAGMTIWGAMTMRGDHKTLKEWNHG